MLRACSENVRSMCNLVKLYWQSLLVGNKDLESLDDLGKRNALVALPVAGGLEVVDKDDEVLVLALVVDLGLLSLAASHGA